MDEERVFDGNVVVVFIVVMVVFVSLPLTTNWFSLFFSEIRLRIGLSDLRTKSTNDLPRATPKAVTNRPFRPLPISTFDIPLRIESSFSSLASRFYKWDDEEYMDWAPALR